MQIIIGIVIILHGLVHFWYVTLSQRWVEFQPEMGWTSESWLLSNLLSAEITRITATLLYSLAAITFLVGGVGLISNRDFSRIWLIVAPVISSLAIIGYWDGNFNKLIEKGLLGLSINFVILAAIFVFGWLTG